MHTHLLDIFQTTPTIVENFPLKLLCLAFSQTPTLEKPLAALADTSKGRAVLKFIFDNNPDKIKDIATIKDTKPSVLIRLKEAEDGKPLYEALLNANPQLEITAPSRVVPISGVWDARTLQRLSAISRSQTVPTVVDDAEESTRSAELGAKKK